jgi:hypothetical protein
MAIGLEDLKKRRQLMKIAPAPAKTEVSRMPSRPWSNRGFHKAAALRASESDFHMNEDWLSMQDQSLFLVDISLQNELIDGKKGLQLHKKLASLEQNILDSVERVKNFWGFITVKKI